MSLLLFDTTFLVDADRGGKRLDVVVGDTDDVAMAAITVAELLVGVELSTGRARRSRRAFLDDVLAGIPVLDYDRSVAESHASSWWRCAAGAAAGGRTTSSSRQPPAPPTAPS